MSKSGRSPKSKATRSRHKETGVEKPTGEMVRQTGEPFRLLVESVKDYAIFILDQEGYIVTWNLGAENIKGYSADEVIGKHFSILYPEEDLKWDKPAYELKVAAEVGRFEDEGWRIRKDGSRFWANVVITALRDNNGALRGFGKVTRDLTERKIAEEQRLQLAREQVARNEAEAASRAKDEFLATVSHELRTPLNAILGWGRMLRESTPGDDSFVRGLNTIERNAKLQAQLIDDLLDVSRIITGKLRLTVMPVDLSPIIGAAFDSVRPAASAKNIRIQLLLDSNAGLISGDPDRLQQVIWNLLSNAVKFTGKDGRVTVRLRRIDSQVELMVSDTGKGISPEFLPYVFDRFRQADSSISRMHGGLGLGLAIVRNVVELHGGTVDAQSPGEGLGATFKVQLPITAANGPARYPLDADEQHPTGTGHQGELASPSLEGLSILVVDDETDARDLLTVILEKSRAKVTTAASAAEAFETLGWLKPNVIISDIGMPGEDGYSFIRDLRLQEAREQHGWIAAIALTAHARIEDRLRAISAGYQAHVAKPVEPAELVALIASLVRPLR